MQKTSITPGQDNFCNPEWVKLNHLLSYCGKPALQFAAKSEGASSEVQGNGRLCNRHTCVFCFKKF